MELKVWCDGIQRIVCGVQPTTTCQDIVQILAYTTGKTGRFILIEKWKNNERILAPNDHPIVSLSKWGEFSNDVCYVLKRTGDLPSNYGGQQPKTAANNNHLNTPKFSGKKSEISELKRKQQHHRISNIENSLKNNDGNHSNMKHSTSAPQHLFRNMVNEDHSNNQNASQQQNLDYLSLTRDTRNTNHHSYHPGRPSKVNNQPAESLYGTLNKPMIRPRKPPPYQEAIAKSSLINKDGIITFQASQNNYIETIPNTATSQTTKQSIPISLVSIQSRQQPPPPQSSNHNDNEFDMIDDEQQLEQELQQLLMDGQQYTNEMKEIKMKLMQNEHEVDRCRNEIERLMAKIDNQLNNCKNESHNPNDDAIDFDSSNSNDYRSIIEKLKSSIQETNDKINVQQTDLQVMDKSLEHYDENMRNKQELIENLIEQIKEANVEGMELQELIDLSANNSKQINDIVWNDEDGQQQSSTILIDSNDKSNLNSLKNQMTIKTNSSSSSSAITNRRIPVSLLELGNTVPTKRNPDGIWV